MTLRHLVTGSLAAALLATPALAATTPAAGKLTLELNALQPSEGACRVTFLATNDLGGPLDKATFELAIFGKDGSISRVVSADFKGLTAGKTKVLQFDLKGLICDDISRVLVNDVTACEGADVAATACLAQLETANKTAIVFGS